MAEAAKNVEITWNRVTRVFTTLVTDLDADQLSDYLIEGQIISVEQWHEIKSQQPTKQGRCRELLSLLIRMKNPGAYEVFMDALERNSQWKWIAKLINREEIKTKSKVDLHETGPMVPGTYASMWHDFPGELERFKMANQRLSSTVSEYEELLHRQKEEIKKLKTENESLSSKVFECTQLLSEHREMEEVIKQELDRVKEECERLRLKVSQYENGIYAGPIRYKAKPELFHRTPAEKERAAIKGIAILIDDLYAIFENRSDMLVYNSVTLCQKRNAANIKSLRNPQDIASCPRKKCLYVIDQLLEDAQESHLLKIDPEGNKPMTRWNHIDCQGGRLSVYDGNIILCLPEKRIIVKYSPSGEILLTIRLSPSDGFDYLHHVIQVTETYFVVSSYNRGLQKLNLCLIDCDGKIITSMKDENNQFKAPLCLISDRDKSVLALIHGQKRPGFGGQTKDLVLLFNHQLQNLNTLIEHSSDEYGVKMCLDGTGTRLFVAVNSRDQEKASWHSGRILIFNLK